MSTGAMGRLLVGALAGASAWLGACAGPARTTSLRTEDLELVASAMAEKLKQSHFLDGRGPGQPKLLLAVRAAENLSSDVMTAADRWYLVEGLTGELPLSTLARDYSIAFVIPEERARAAVERGAVDADAFAGRRPTHVLTATVQSVTRASGADRTDLYALEYRIVELETGVEQWSDTFEFKRAARGKSYD